MTNSIWQEDIHLPNFPRLKGDHKTDVLIIGAGAAVLGQKLALEIVDVWLATEFSHGERHQRRIDKIMALEQ